MNQDLRKAIQNASKGNDEIYSFVGEVLNIDTSKRTCDVRPLNGSADLFDVRLQAVEGNTGGWFLLPKKGSKIIVSFTSNVSAYAAAFSEIDEQSLQIGTLKMRANTVGVHWENNGGDLRKIVDALVEKSEKVFDFLINLKVITPTGTGILSPEMIAQVTAEKVKLTALKQQINQLLK